VQFENVVNEQARALNLKNLGLGENSDLSPYALKNPMVRVIKKGLGQVGLRATSLENIGVLSGTMGSISYIKASGIILSPVITGMPWESPASIDFTTEDFR
jgi:hypothetical protein